MTRITFELLKQLAKSKDILVERTGKKIHWWHRTNHACIGECSSVNEAYSEIYGERKHETK